jgi:tetratricopeptide (TPR) repeat protein
MSKNRWTGALSLAMGAILAFGVASAIPSSPPREKSAESPKDDQETLYEQGVDLAKSEEYAEARKIFERLAVEQPRDPEVLNMLAFTQRKTGDLDAAMDNYRKALAIRPKFPQAREYLAEAFLQAALREAETLRSYGGEGEEELGTLAEAFEEASSRVAAVRGGKTSNEPAGKDTKKSTGW